LRPGTENRIRNIGQRFEGNNVDNITYIQWVTTDSSTLETTVQSCSDFFETFAEKLNILLRYSFVAQEQSCFHKDLKLKLKTGEIAVICGFSENYSIIHDEIQGFHWNIAQATLHSSVAYLQNEMTEHITFVVTSDCIKHGIVAVHLFQIKLCSSLW
jgi:ABC-type uncharacterized transport system ATPase subunit